ncbi:MAG TPA: sugar phosphate isomerase/epimerase [Bryobacteraceae bacterium]|nr:sugar phosphate isomerase/epimerase [Bryobacteraceae bacterium]
MHRREFLGGSGIAAFGLQAGAASRRPVRLGVDLFSLRSQGWTPFQYLDYCHQWGAKVVHFSEIRFIGSLEPEHLKKVRAHAESLGIELEIGMRSICPTSKMFDPSQGTAEEQLARMIQAAKLVGSPIVRAVLGSAEDRRGPLPIEAHIKNTVQVLRAVRSRVLDNGLKVAIENHAGDMQGRELRMLIEEAGKDFVGACLDSGNPLWTIEDPHLTLETLAPYVLTSHIRDTAVWLVPEGAAVAWVRMGEGNIGIDAYVRQYTELCPGRALSLEVIVVPQPRLFPYHDPRFWEAYRNTPAWEFARFVTLVENGKPHPNPAPVAREQAASREREDFEASMRYTKELLQRLG